MNLPVKYGALNYEQKRAVREEYVRVQNNLCAHCKEDLDGPPSVDVANRWINKDLFPKDFLKWPIHLHHDHNTGMTIGAVHSRCNGVLWQYFRE